MAAHSDSTNEHPDWWNAQHFVLGYGSLLSASSRTLHSDNPHPALAVEVTGFKREWITRAFHESQTYVGAIADQESVINAHCVPFALNPKLQSRERDYRFVEVGLAQVNALNCPNVNLIEQLQKPDVSLWICESLDVYPSNAEHPIYQSYIDTCLSGCISHFDGHNKEFGLQHARHFIRSTGGWQHIVDDRADPQYPRHAMIDAYMQSLIDSLLAQELVE